MRARHVVMDESIALRNCAVPIASPFADKQRRYPFLFVLLMVMGSSALARVRRFIGMERGSG